MNDHPLSGYSCVTEAATSDSAVYGEVTTVTLDTASSWVYRELLDRIEADGYELVGFGIDDGGNQKATFVYRGADE